jgi:hypothetical protein
MLFGEFHHIVRKREDGVVDGLVEIIENTVHAGFCLSDSVALTMGLSSEALLILQRPQGLRDQILSSDSQMMLCSPSAPRKI